MSIVDIFSKRQKRLRGETSDVYQYELIPSGLRVQLVHIFRDAYGDPGRCHNSQAPILLIAIHDTLCREYGEFAIGRADEYAKQSYDDIFRFLLEEADPERVLDAVELLARAIDRGGRNEDFVFYNKPALGPDEAISELNSRFREHAVGFQYESGEMVRVDSHLLHAEAVKPALRFLGLKAYQGANEEFLRAHEHYRHKRYKEAMNDALKSFESVLKAICHKRKWTYDPNAPAKKLLAVVFEKGLVPTSLQTHFSSLRSGLESGIPTLRNKLSGHGQGAVSQSVPAHFISYHLHLTASAILFLCECDEELG